MSATAKVTFRDFTAKTQVLYGTITPAGNYAANGDPLDLTASTTGGPGDSSPETGDLALQVEIFSAKVTALSGYLYGYVPGTTLANGKMQVLEAPASGPNPLADIGAGAYPAGVTGDTILFRAIFKRQSAS